MGSDIYLVQAVSNGQEISKPRGPASCEDTAAAAPPDVRKAAKARSALLAALIIRVLTPKVYMLWGQV